VRVEQESVITHIVKQDRNRFSSFVHTMKYFSKALFNPWNLVVVTAAAVAAYFSPSPEYLLPAVGAVELAYLTFAATSEPFQRKVDMEERSKSQKANSFEQGRVLDKMLNSLPQEYRSKFQSLRKRCQELAALTAPITQTNDRGVQTFESQQTKGLDELLWTYLKLLSTHQALAKFLSTTSEEQIAVDIKRLENRLQEAATNEDAEQRVQLTTALQDSLATSQERLLNVQRTQRNYDVVRVEMERLENKIRSLSELGINRTETETIRRQVNLLADELKSSEQTIQELRAITNIEDLAEAPPLVTNKLLAAR
jgi:chemotaxis protein histidine kinase CheA